MKIDQNQQQEQKTGVQENPEKLILRRRTRMKRLAFVSIFCSIACLFISVLNIRPRAANGCNRRSSNLPPPRKKRWNRRWSKLSTKIHNCASTSWTRLRHQLLASCLNADLFLSRSSSFLETIDSPYGTFLSAVSEPRLAIVTGLAVREIRGRARVTPNAKGIAVLCESK